MRQEDSIDIDTETDLRVAEIDLSRREKGTDKYMAKSLKIFAGLVEAVVICLQDLFQVSQPISHREICRF